VACPLVNRYIKTLGVVDLSYIFETEVIYLDTEALDLKFSHSKQKVSNEGRRINGPARRVFLKTPSLSVETCLFGWPNFTDFALIEDILGKSR